MIRMIFPYHKMKNMSLSLLIPAYNEQDYIGKTVGELVGYLNSEGIDNHEIIICCNGCTDNTVEIARKLAKEHKTVTCFVTKMRGLGSALRLGIEKSGKEFLTFLPADSEVEYEFIKKALACMGEYDYVMGSKRLSGEFKSSNTVRTLLSYFYSQYVKILFGASDLTSVFMTQSRWLKESLGEFRRDDFGFQIEVYVNARNKGLRIKEIPVRRLVNRNTRNSSVNIFRDSTSLLITSIRLRLTLL